jgi:hypothetical protein
MSFHVFFLLKQKFKVSAVEDLESESTYHAVLPKLILGLQGGGDKTW